MTELDTDIESITNAILSAAQSNDRKCIENILHGLVKKHADPLRKENLTVGTVTAYEAGVLDGKREEYDQLDSVLVVIQEFAARCERNEIRSVYTYNKFKDILKNVKENQK